MIYVEKHLYALYQNKLDDSEFEERVKDIIVYMLLSLGMKDAYNKVEDDFICYIQDVDWLK